MLFFTVFSARSALSAIWRLVRRAGFPVLSAPPPSVAALAWSEARWEAQGQVKCPDQGRPKV
jgi:hypothetical protein